MITIESIKEALKSDQLPMQGTIVRQETLLTSDGEELKCDLYYGWDIVKCHACDRDWGLYNVRLMEFIRDQKYDKAKLKEVLDEIQIDDNHWDWFNKAACYLKDGYHWFFLMADGKQQAACLIYHPKKSVAEDLDIFYVEYIAVAPWNRKNPMQVKLLSGVGGLMIKLIIKHVSEQLKFAHGFSLHAIPKASGFYSKIGMLRYNAHDKGPLQYFEMPQKVASVYMEAK